MLNPIIASEEIKDEFIGYITTSFNIADKEYAKDLKNELSKENFISKGPYLDISDSFVKGSSIRELIDEGVVSNLFYELEGDIPDGNKELQIDRQLYLHQENSIRQADNNQNLIVTTGTGSGKTECFIIPIINHLLKEKEEGTLSSGVRAILIYPMNALANDQMKRLREILKEYQDITFGVYNGDTKFSEDDAIVNYGRIYKDHNERPLKPLKNEVISRENMQKSPPHILVTNYAMLEYMLLRPNDDLVFSGAKLHFIILDEAHTYRGATGMETSLLIRRLKARISDSNKVVHILTSATLGGEEANKEIIQFAKTLCATDFKEENIIRSETENPNFENKANEYPMSLFEELANPKESLNSILNKYDINFDCSKKDGEILYDLCLDSKAYRRLREVAKKPMTVSEIAMEMNTSKDDVVNIISVASLAEKNKTALIKARYHMFIRALEGGFITIGDNKKFFLERKNYYQENGKEYKVFEAVLCNSCGRIGIVGQVIANRLEFSANRFSRDEEYYLLKPEEEEFYSEEEEVGKETSIDKNDYLICPFCGEIHHVSQKVDFKCGHDLNQAVKLFKVEKTKSRDIKCPSCSFGNLKSFYLGYEAATSVLATSLFEQIPESEIILKSVEEESDIDNPFLSGIKKPMEEIRRKKQFLAFSDSRSEAAYFASYMSKYYKEFIRRRGILHVIKNNKQNMINNPWGVEDLVEELTGYFDRERSFAEPDDHDSKNLTVRSKRQAWVAVLNELVNFRRETSLSSLGILKFSYKGNTNELMNGIARSHDKKPNHIKALFDLIVLDIVGNRAIKLGDLNNISDDEKEYIFYGVKNNLFKLTKDVEKDKGKSYLYGWIPRKKSTGRYYYNGRVKRVMDCLGIKEEEDAIKLLENYWHFLINEKLVGHLESNKNSEYQINPNSFYVIPSDGEKEFVYKCNKCGRITMFNFEDRCSYVKCDGKLKVINNDELLDNNHFAKLYSTKMMKPLHIKEHTAQLGRKEQQNYQEMFVSKKINALSCSTTFEMGVDVGDLETVYLRNIPPSPANYVQRAGRAGRSLRSTAYALTYSKLSSHDFTYFKDPTKMISGNIQVPIFTIQNRKVIKRHIFAVALSMFFAENEDVYNGNDADIFLNEYGFDKFVDFLNRRSENLKIMLKNSIPEYVHQFMGIDDYSWIEELIGEDGALTIAINDYKDIVKWYEKEEKRLIKSGDIVNASAYSKKLKKIRKSEKDGEGKNNLIEFLARNNILPKYGFPIDTVELYQNSDFSTDRKLQIVRDLQLAISEYAPGSQVVVDDKLYTSRYIRKSPNMGLDWEVNYIAQCDNEECKTWNWRKTAPSSEGETCISCKNNIANKNWKATIEPRKGFIADSDFKNVPMTKPERLYGSDAHYIGDIERHNIDAYYFLVNNEAKIILKTSSNDSLMVVCNNNFYVCDNCGYAESIEEEASQKKIEEKKHKNSLGKACKQKLKQYSLSHAFKTDVVNITFVNSQAKSKNVMLSVMYALLESVATVLDIERNDIKGCLHKVKDKGRLIHSIILYDAVAGGAGHVRRLVSDDGEKLKNVIKEAINITKNCNCNPSCYSCLRNYYNQKFHDILSREEAYRFLENFVGEMSLLDEDIEGEEQDSTDRYINQAQNIVSEGDIVFDDNHIDCSEYSNWSSLNYIYPDKYDILFKSFDEKNIKLPDKALVEVTISGEKNVYTEILFKWDEERIMLFDDDCQILKIEGWKSFYCKDINSFTFLELLSRRN